MFTIPVHLQRALIPARLSHWLRPLAALLAILALNCRLAAQQQYPASTPVSGSDPKQRILDALPAPISDGLEIDGWGWFSYLHNSDPKNDITDTVLSIDITKSIAQRVALGFEGNLINADGAWRGEVEQLYVSIRPAEDYDGILTLGKFNAGFGVEERDFWNRTHGTTSLLFGAQPQDLVGFISSLPLGSTGIKMRPFVALDFQGQPEYNQPPLGGVQVQYRPASEWQFSWTGLTGPGFVPFHGEPLRHPYPQGSYGSAGISAIENWQGPNLVAERRGTLLFGDANVIWRPRNDLLLGLEGLYARTGTSRGHDGWWGAMVTGDFNVTDRFHVFGRFSYLDDSDWLIYGEFQKLYEVSFGAGYRLFDKVEVRGEYRHDRGSDTGNSDTFSIHLTAGF